MAVDLQKLKRKMRGVSSTRQVTRALQMVASMRMRKAREQSIHSRIYREALHGLVETFEMPPASVVPELASTSTANEVLVVTFASDRGLCGPYNHNVLRVVDDMAFELGEENVRIKAIGIKVGGSLRRRGYGVLSNIRRPDAQDREFVLKELSRDLLEAWTSGRYRRIDLVYSSLDGMTVRKPVAVPWLPIPGFEEDSEEQGPAPVGKYIDEPVEGDVLRAAVLRTLENELLSAFLQSEASEHVARMVAMDNATRNAEELFTSLQLTYNKARQAKITQEICEIVAGANAIG